MILPFFWSQVFLTFNESKEQNPDFFKKLIFVFSTFGKIAYYMDQDNPYFAPLKNVLFTLAGNPNVEIAEPAVLALYAPSILSFLTWPSAVSRVSLKLFFCSEIRMSRV